MAKYCVGVDGGGSGTRVAVATAQREILGRGVAGPSALGQGVEGAWKNILKALDLAFSDAGIAAPPWSDCAMGVGLSGIGYAPNREGFLSQNPGFAAIFLESDSYAMLLGAHAGAAGMLLAAGTGSVAEALYSDGQRKKVGGWGFPVGDEGSGSWLGLQAMAHAHAAFDGRQRVGSLAQAIWSQCGATRAELLAWCAQAKQFQYGQLAPLVFESAATDPIAEQLLKRAAQELELLANALDPAGTLPLAVSGSIGRALQSRMSTALNERMVEPQFDAVFGALLLID